MISNSSNYINKMALSLNYLALITLNKMVMQKSKHRHILGIVRSFLITASFPKRFWREAAVTTLYAIMSPLFYHPQQNSLFLYCKSPTYTHFRVLGCACFVLLSLHERSNLESTSRLYCFFDYGIN